MHHCQVASLWVYGDIPDYVRLCINSFLAHGHSYTLFTYNNVSIPGVNVRDAREILPEEYIWYDAATGSLAPFSDLFRWALLQKEGGVWVDADLACLRDDIPLDASLYMCYEDAARYFVSAACIKLPKNHVVAKTLYEYVYEPLSRQPWDDDVTYRKKVKFYSFDLSRSGRMERERRIPWSYSSTRGLTCAVKHYDMQYCVHPHTDMFLVDWKQARSLYNGDVSLDQFTDNWGIHLWGHELRTNSLSIHTGRKCVMQELLDRYGT